MSLLETLPNLPHWQIDLLVIGLLLQGAVFTVFPEEVVFITLGVLWSQGKVIFPEVMIAAQIGLLPANLATAWLGSKLGKRLMERKSVQEALTRLHRYGSGLIFATRFTPIVRGPVYFAVGISGFSLKRFFVADYLASLIQIPGLLLLGRVIGKNAASMGEAYRMIGLIAGSILAIGILFVLGRELRKKAPLAALILAGVLVTHAQAQANPIPMREYQGSKPKLVLVLVMDQFRADYLTRFGSRFLPARLKDGSVGGYAYLTSQAAYFPFAQYDVLQCMTGPGHAMIMSGSYPYQMGIPLNDWFDTATNKLTYSASDPLSPMVGADVQPGISPKNFKGTSVGDELKNAGYPSKVVSVALKDRAAVFMGGHRADLAFWFEPTSFHWVSSRYYLKDGKLPPWMTKLNGSIDSRKGKSYVWEESGAKLSGLTFGKGFRHQAEIGKREILNYPFGLDLTAEAAETAFDAFELGRGKSTDILAVSFSSHDYLGHLYGPNTLEMEEMTAAEDRMISRVLNRVAKKVPGGLKNVVIVLTADHGVQPSSTWLASVGIEAGGVPGPEIQEKMDERLSAKFGKPKTPGTRWVQANVDLNFFLNPDALKELGVSREAAEEEMKAELRSNRGVAYVFSRTDIENRKFPPGMFERQALKTYVPGRSGDVIAIPRPFFANESGSYPLEHMTGYSYDRTVPLVLAGARMRPGVYGNPADVVDIAPTLSFVLGILPPATSEGRVLHEILR